MHLRLQDLGNPLYQSAVLVSRLHIMWLENLPYHRLVVQFVS